MAVFRVAGGFAADLAEVFEVVQADIFVAGEVEQAVKQHGAVAGGKHEAVAIGPGGALWVEVQKFRK